MSLSAKAALEKLKKDPKLRLQIMHHEQGNYSWATLVDVESGEDHESVQLLGARKLLNNRDLVLEKEYAKTITRQVQEYASHNKSKVTLLEERIDDLTKQVTEAMKELRTLKNEGRNATKA